MMQKFRPLVPNTLSLLQMSDPPFQEIIDAGVVSRFALFLKCDDKPSLQSNAATCLASLANSNKSEHISKVVEADTIPTFVRLLKTSSNQDVLESAVLALRNISYDSSEFRDLALNEGAMLTLLMYLEKRLNLVWKTHEIPDLEALRCAAGALSNLFRGEPKPNFKSLQTSLPTLKRLLAVPDDEVLGKACFSLARLSQSTENTKVIFESGVIPCLVELLKNASTCTDVQDYVLTTVINIAAQDPEDVQVLINQNVLPNIVSLLSSPSKDIRRNACWAVRNIAAGNMEQRQAVIDNKSIPLLIQMLADDENDLRCEAAHAIRNIAVGGCIQQVRCLVSEGCLAALSDLLEADMDFDTIITVLVGLEGILKVGRELSRQVKYNQMATLLSEAQGLTRIRTLVDHHNTEVSQKCHKILSRYFPVICDTQTVLPEDASEENKEHMATASCEAESQKKRPRYSEPDLLITVGKDANRKEYRYLSQTMAVQSGFIDTMLTSGIGEQGKSIDLTHLSPQVWDSMMKFLKPQEARNMTAKDVMVVAPAYDQYDFTDGLQCCDQVLTEYISKAIDGTEEVPDLEFLIDAFILSDERNLISAKQGAIRYFRDVLATTGPRGRVLFTEEHIRKLAPLIAKENLLGDNEWTKEEILNPMFPSHLVLRWTSWRLENELLKAVYRVKVELGEVNGTFDKKSDFEYICQQMEHRGTNCIYKITRCNCHSDWVLRVLERGNAADGSWKTLWKCPKSRNFRLPPRENWIAVHGTGNKPKILGYEYERSLT